MIYIGSHLSSEGGFMAMGQHALKLGADTFAFFTRNPRGGSARKINEEDARSFMDFCSSRNFGPLVAHAPYTMNLCSDKQGIRDFALDMLKDDIRRMEYVPGNYYNFHPGSHVGQGQEEAIPVIARALNNALFDGCNTTVLLETMAGKGTEVGRTFEELAKIIDMVRNKDNIGVCLDTCHVWDAGYNIEDMDSVLDEFDKIIGIDRLKAIHINDSKNPMGASKDRHEKIGQGFIGEEILRKIVTNPRLQNKPFILETPNDDSGYEEEIKTIRSWMI